MIDTHAHLDACDDPADARARARARPASTRILAVGTTIERAGGALALAERHDGVFAILGIHPHEAGAVDDGRLDELRALLAHPRAVAVGETGLDYFRDYAPHERAAALFDGQLALAAELGKPVVIHTRAADDDTLAALAGFDGTVVLHCFSSPALLAGGARARLVRLVRRQRHLPERVRPPRRRRAGVPADRLLAETDSPYLAPQPVRGRPNEPAYVVHTLAALAEARGEDAGRARGADRRERRRAPSACREASRPKKELGQHFLVDENILGVIGRLAELEPDDVVLEIGPGLGVLTRFLAERVAHVHAVEIDRSLEPHLRELPNVRRRARRRARARPRRARPAAATSSSRTCRTTSRRRSSSRASTGCRRSSSGA